MDKYLYQARSYVARSPGGDSPNIAPDINVKELKRLQGQARAAANLERQKATSLRIKAQKAQKSAEKVRQKEELDRLLRPSGSSELRPGVASTECDLRPFPTDNLPPGMSVGVPESISIWFDGTQCFYDIRRPGDPVATRVVFRQRTHVPPVSEGDARCFYVGL